MGATVVEVLLEAVELDELEESVVELPFAVEPDEVVELDDVARSFARADSAEATAFWSVATWSSADRDAVSAAVQAVEPSLALPVAVLVDDVVVVVDDVADVVEVVVPAFVQALCA